MNWICPRLSRPQAKDCPLPYFCLCLKAAILVKEWIGAMSWKNCLLSVLYPWVWIPGPWIPFNANGSRNDRCSYRIWSWLHLFLGWIRILSTAAIGQRRSSALSLTCYRGSSQLRTTVGARISVTEQGGCSMSHTQFYDLWCQGC